MYRLAHNTNHEKIVKANNFKTVNVPVVMREDFNTENKAKAKLMTKNSRKLKSVTLNELLSMQTSTHVFL